MTRAGSRRNLRPALPLICSDDSPFEVLELRPQPRDLLLRLLTAPGLGSEQIGRRGVAAAGQVALDPAIRATVRNTTVGPRGGGAVELAAA